MNENNLPSQYKPLSAWAYFGYSILFTIPLIGQILIIVFALSNENINRRNFARFYIITWIIGIVCGVIGFIISMLLFYLSYLLAS